MSVQNTTYELHPSSHLRSCRSGPSMSIVNKRSITPRSQRIDPTPFLSLANDFKCLMHNCLNVILPVRTVQRMSRYRKTFLQKKRYREHVFEPCKKKEGLLMSRTVKQHSKFPKTGVITGKDEVSPLRFQRRSQYRHPGHRTHTCLALSPTRATNSLGGLAPFHQLQEGEVAPP